MNFQFLTGSPWKKSSKKLEIHSSSPKLLNSANRQISDRFIPQRVNGQDLSILAKEIVSNGNISNIQENQETQHDDNQANPEEFVKNYQILLKNQLVETFFQEELEKISIPASQDEAQYQFNHGILKYKKKSRIKGPEFTMQLLSPQKLTRNSLNSYLNCWRKIDKIPYKILDAPALLDDYYLNLIDWSSNNNIGIGLNNSVYIWCASNNRAHKIFTSEINESVSSIQWDEKSNFLAIGETQGNIKLFDAEVQKVVSEITGHLCRVSSLSWNGPLLSSGSRDKSILQRDVRCPKLCQFKFQGHKQEVCGLKWSPDKKVLASGGNDNKLMIWNLRTQSQAASFSNHQAAVKAIAWHPHQANILASGGGKSDRTIKFWNINNHSLIESIDTGSQVCNLLFSVNSDELISSHGFSMNEINVWSYPDMTKLTSLTGHTSRVLYLSLSPDGENVVSGAGDETLRFWHIFPPRNGSDIFCTSSTSPSCTNLR